MHWPFAILDDDLCLCPPLLPPHPSLPCPPTQVDLMVITHMLSPAAPCVIHLDCSIFPVPCLSPFPWDMYFSVSFSISVFYAFSQMWLRIVLKCYKVQLFISQLREETPGALGSALAGLAPWRPGTDSFCSLPSHHPVGFPLSTHLVSSTLSSALYSSLVCSPVISRSFLRNGAGKIHTDTVSWENFIYFTFLFEFNLLSVKSQNLKGIYLLPSASRETSGNPEHIPFSVLCI